MFVVTVKDSEGRVEGTVICNDRLEAITLMALVEDIDSSLTCESYGASDRDQLLNYLKAQA